MQIDNRTSTPTPTTDFRRTGPETTSFAGLLQAQANGRPVTPSPAVAPPLVAQQNHSVMAEIRTNPGVWTDDITGERTPVQREGHVSMMSPRLGATPADGRTYVGRNASQVDANTLSVYGDRNRLVGGRDVPNSLAVGGSNNTLIGGDRGNHFVVEGLPIFSETGTIPASGNTLVGGRGNDTFRDPQRGTVWFGGGTNLVTGLGSNATSGDAPWRDSVDEALRNAGSVDFNRGLPDDPTAAQGERNILDVSVNVPYPTKDGGAQLDREQFGRDRRDALDAYAQGLRERGLIGPNGAFDEVRVRTGSLGDAAVITTSPTGEITIRDVPR